MNLPTARARVALSLCACAALLFDFLGWAGWNAATERLASAPVEGAARLSDSYLLDVPPAVQRSRRLPVRSLQQVPTDLAAAVLMRASAAQHRWMVAHPSWATNAARGSLLTGNIDAATEALDEALSRDPTSASLHRLRALLQMSQGEVGPALDELARAKALAPDLNEPEIELTPENRRVVRLRSLELRRDLYPRQRLQTTVALARELRGQGEAARGRALLIELGPHPEALLERSRWAIDDGDPGTATELLERVTAMGSAPRRYRARAWAMLAVARDIEGDQEGASDAAFLALDLDPSSPDVFVALAGLADRRGDHELALEHLRRAWGMAPTDVRLLVRIAAVAERAGKIPDAELALERAVELEPSSPDLAARLVSLQIRNGNYTTAAVTLSRALDRHPTDPALLALADRLRREIGIR